MKYIPADKLIAEIERRMKCYDRDGYEPNDGKWVELVTMKRFITSLQQEQPDAYEDAMLEVKEYVDKLYDHASIGLNEYDSGLYNGIAETCMKLRGFIKARISMEQPEVDLEKEIEMYISSKGLRDCAFLVPSIARHFYELGKNSK